MKKVISLLLLMTLLFNCQTIFAENEPISMISAKHHIENIGWENLNSDQNNHIILGTIGRALRLEAFSLQVNVPDLGIQYMSYIQDVGWQEDKADGEVSGSEGQAKQIEAVALRLTGAEAPNYKLYYRTHVQNYGWLDWATEYAAAGTINHNYRCEAIEIVIYPKNAPAPGSTTTTWIFANSINESIHINAVNQYRKSRGVSFVSGNPQLLNVAQHRVRELPTRFSHIRPNGKPYETIVKDIYPNYHSQGGEIVENISLARTPLLQRPDYSFDYLSTYQHQLDIVADPAARFVAWTAIATPRMGYSIEIFSGLDQINFNN